ncbi:MAG: hypothetical protein JW874_16435 [Spirochaetales bacterium]|nr:hypothetical protein [Spirochaetales bacterium]
MNRVYNGFLILVLFSAFGMAYAQNTKPVQNVLVLHPILETGEWVNEFNQGFYDKIIEQRKSRTGLFFKNLGVEMVPNIVNEDYLLDELRFAGKVIRPEVIVSVFPTIHTIMIDHGQEIFPDAAKVFVPVIAPLYNALNSIPGSYIIMSSSAFAMEQTLTDIRRICPNVRNILVCSGADSEDIPYLNSFRAIAERFADDFSFEYLTGPTLDELFDVTSSLEKNHAVFLLPINRDNNQVIYTTDSIFPKLSQVAAAPIFSFSDSSFGHGIVGGNMTSARAYGEYAAEITMKILDDRNFRLDEMREITREMYDWRQLRRWKIREDQLPAGSLLLYKDESFLEKYRYQIILAVFILLLQTFWIIILIIQLKQRRKVELQLKKSLTEKEILLREIHHRVKNNLAIVSSFLALQSSNISDQNIQSYFLSSQNRIRSMALIHELLYKDENLKHIDLQEYINQLVNEIIYSYHEKAHNIELRLAVEDIKISFDILISLGLIINEIVSNSMKHAFAGVKNPSLEIKIYQRGSSVFLETKDNGSGIPDEDNSEQKGTIGSLLIKALVQQIHGKLEITANGGTRYVISFIAS